MMTSFDTYEAIQQKSVSRLRSEESAERILVVEDNVDLQTVLLRLVESVAPTFEVDWCVDAEAARQKIRRRRYRLLLADYELAGLQDGLTLLESLARHQPWAQFAMMSASRFEDVVGSQTQKKFPFLSKPFDSREFKGFLLNVL